MGNGAVHWAGCYFTLGCTIVGFSLGGSIEKASNNSVQSVDIAAARLKQSMLITVLSYRPLRFATFESLLGGLLLTKT